MRDYAPIKKMMESLEYEAYKDKKSTKQMLEDVTESDIGCRIIRPTTPPMKIPTHKIIYPSEGKTEMMLLPHVSVFQREQIDKEIENFKTTKPE